jgi:hypothetical protein
MIRANFGSVKAELCKTRNANLKHGSVWHTYPHSVVLLLFAIVKGIVMKEVADILITGL